MDSLTLNHLAICLIDAIQDTNMNFLIKLLKEKKGNPNKMVNLGYAPIHYAVGFENASFGLRALKLFMDFGGNVNLPTLNEGYTPLHIAAMNSRSEAAEFLISRGADVYAKDTEDNQPIHHATIAGCYEIVRLIQCKISRDKMERHRPKPLQLLQKNESRQILGDSNQSSGLTPSRIIYDFNPSSPYYINITHRKRVTPPNSAPCSPATPMKSSVNIFELTETNLFKFSESLRRSGKFNMLQRWRENIAKYQSRKSYLEEITKEMQLDLGPSYPEIDPCLIITDDESEAGDRGVILEELLEPPKETGEFKIKSPLKRRTFTVVQSVEEYVCEDADKHILFKELKRLPIVEDESEHGSTKSSKIADFRLDTDYDTDVLRTELVSFGEAPGPITKNTKKLYLKRLHRYKTDPETAEAVKRAAISRVYSVELERTFRLIEEGVNCFVDLLKLETEMVQKFQTAPKPAKLREGNRKMSFIYLLLDPRELNNLAGEHLLMTKLEVWRQFLGAIFYVGKGKKSRPYAHLYEAIRCFSETNKPLEDGETNEKLARILDIWKDGKGVVCLHVFHSITPSEAYTREAAIIDALGLQNLTNQKRGDYYGVVQSWTLRERKKLGVALLFKALHIHLIEGESQLMPHDLV